MFFTNFTGTFWLYVGANELGLERGPGGLPGHGDNIDALEISCAVDLDWDGDIGADDFVRVMTSWGRTTPSEVDLNRDGIVDFQDLIVILASWGPAS